MGFYKQAMIAAGDRLNRPPTHEEVLDQLDKENLMSSLNAMMDERGLRSDYVPTPTANYSTTPRNIRCGNCKGTHPTVDAVRECHTAPKAAAFTAKEFDPGYYDNAHPDHNSRGVCGRCGGTGQFITGMVNGKLTGPGGICFRCEGKGRQSCCTKEQHRERMIALRGRDADRTACCDVVRNDLFDRFGIRWNI